ncbi:ABC transporter permease [Marinovum sp.]|uniref:ABC transporter permease n=1 Tax=Marinovum sp. TaxID=2024839 RepID=UPI002B26A662|nr:ABC transporter permease [Marinovum sp.]
MLLLLIVRRLFLTIPTLFGVALLAFLLVHMAPGDPALAALGLDADGAWLITEADLVRVREDLGLNKPIAQQFGDWVWRALQGDFGRSYVQNTEVTRMVLKALPTTMILLCLTMGSAIVIGCTVGVLSAIYRGRTIDYVARFISILGVSTPTFWFALLLIWSLAYLVPIFPMNGPIARHGMIAMVLPTMALALHPAALIARMMRSSMLEVLSHDMIRTATAKGLTKRRVYFVHALRNAVNPVITVVGFQFANLMGGAVAVEFIFSLPGLGSLLIDSIYQKDVLVMQGAVLLIGVVFAASNLIVDLLYMIIDPRVRL